MIYCGYCYRPNPTGGRCPHCEDSVTNAHRKALMSTARFAAMLAASISLALVGLYVV